MRQLHFTLFTGGNDKIGEDGGEDKRNDGSAGVDTLDPMFVGWTMIDRWPSDLSSSKCFWSVCTFSLKYRWDGNSSVKNWVLLLWLHVWHCCRNHYQYLDVLHLADNLPLEPSAQNQLGLTIPGRGRACKDCDLFYSNPPAALDMLQRPSWPPAITLLWCPLLNRLACYWRYLSIWVWDVVQLLGEHWLWNGWLGVKLGCFEKWAWEADSIRCQWLLMMRVVAKPHLFICQDMVHWLHAASRIHKHPLRGVWTKWQWTMNEWTASLKLSHDQCNNDIKICM